MDADLTPTPTIDATTIADDRILLAKVIDAVHDAGARLLAVYSPDARPADRSEMFYAGRRNEELSLDSLRAALLAARPEAQWVEDDQETGALPAGEWWTVDAVEGNVNHVHGLPEWCVSVTLLRDTIPVLTAVYQPVGDLTYTAIRSAGAHLNGRPLHTSTKSDLGIAIVTTGQAEAGQESTYRRLGDSITAMLSRALLVRATVPSTFPLLLVASGHCDVFWQYEPVLPGIAAGALLVTEAGGIVSDVHGQSWRPGSTDILATALNLHGPAIEALATVA
ncbi:MAG: 3'(2'),5'-bisphosphate nucleotidase CysQ [Herpetosiphonaceae bacterium]|nr:3'(2'),5'-bisphosphate nucleotidase CysQ [Herpetosiphonaceae bacterium]